MSTSEPLAPASRIIVEKELVIAALAVVGIALHLWLRFILDLSQTQYNIPLYLVLVFGGLPLVYDLSLKLLKREFGSDLLAGISIVTSVFLDEYLAGSLVVLMLSGGESLESYAVRSASSVLQALAKRIPNIAHRKYNGQITDIALDEIRVGDTVVIYPHEICPVDGEVIEGHGAMDEAYLTGEPYVMSKTPGSMVLSGAVNEESALTIRATKLPVDSRYAKIVKVMRDAEQHRPRIRRLGDQLGAVYTPVAVAIAIIAWLFTGEATRFLAVLVVATPCPLLIAIPVSIIGSISLAAKRGIVVKDPSVLEQIENCRTIIFDKTGTLTYGEPSLEKQITPHGFDQRKVLKLVASAERYSKHPLATAVVAQAKKEGINLAEAASINETPGKGLRAIVDGHSVLVTNRKKLIAELGDSNISLPQQPDGLECVVAIDGKYAATYRFRDAPRSESKSFIEHLKVKHPFTKVMLVSGDRDSEVEHLAKVVGITELYASASPEDKVQIVKRERKLAKTLFIGDGINDAPALMTADIGIAFGQNSDITTEAAGAVIMDTSLAKVDEFFHISQRMRRIALQSAVGGMALSILGMFFAATGYLTPVAGAVTQEIIDVLAILNALRVALPPKSLIDFD